ncbi:MAG: Na+/H+ antiporter NhaA [SAR202 cluster bacterium]|nr:Na+/H+ antiporter NhaA [SAR202 cluster bacterium]
MTRVPPRSQGTLSRQAEHSYLTRTSRLPVQSFIHTEALGGMVLLAAAVAALVWANSWSESYHGFWDVHLALDMALFEISGPLEMWVNDGLMAIFFFVVGLEIKRELIYGELSSPSKAALPAFAAVGGMVVPAIIFLFINAGGETSDGWAIPMATDIAFALGVLALLGRRCPLELRVFLLALAIVDDLGVIAVISVAYTESVDLAQIGIAAGIVAGLLALNRLGGNHTLISLILGFLLWVAILKSGVHATVAGVLMAALTSSKPNYSHQDFASSSDQLMANYRKALQDNDVEHCKGILGQVEELSQGTKAPLERLERLVHPWTSYVVLPIFAFANAGIEFSGPILSTATSSSLTLGVIVAMVLGKTLGITIFSWIASSIGIGKLPAGVSWGHVVGISLLGGIGFTVAIFVTELTFGNSEHAELSKVGILVASLISGVLGYLVLRLVSVRSQAKGT